jgi:hypothetical protein
MDGLATTLQRTLPKRRSNHPMGMIISARSLALGLAVVLLSGCAAKTTRTLGAAVALRGQAVADAALKAYEALEQQQAIDKRQQDFIRVLTNPNPNPSTLPDAPAPNFTLQLAPRIRAYLALRDAYTAFHRIADTAFGTDTGMATAALTASLSNLKAIGDLPQSVSGALAGLSDLVVQAVQAGQIRKHNRLLLEISQRYRLLWEADVPVWLDYVRRIYKDYADPIGTVPADRFDQRAVGELVKEPVAPALKMQLYKLQLRDTARLKGEELEDRLREVGRALQLLESAHAELAKSRPSIVDATELVDSIRTLLEPPK